MISCDSSKVIVTCFCSGILCHLPGFPCRGWGVIIVWTRGTFAHVLWARGPVCFVLCSVMPSSESTPAVKKSLASRIDRFIYIYHIYILYEVNFTGGLIPLVQWLTGGYELIQRIMCLLPVAIKGCHIVWSVYICMSWLHRICTDVAMSESSKGSELKCRSDVYWMSVRCVEVFHRWEWQLGSMLSVCVKCMCACMNISITSSQSNL